jgi:hypothetical protein
MAEYKLSTFDTVIRIADGAVIPKVLANCDYAAFLAWCEIEGNTPDPADEPVVMVPTSASKLGLKRAFAELGMWEQVKATLAANEDAQEEWDLAIEIKRTDTIVQDFIAIFELTPEFVDQLLIRAAFLTKS